MKRRFLPQRIGWTADSTAKNHSNAICARIEGACALAALLAGLLGAVTGSSQVITIDTSGKGKVLPMGRWIGGMRKSNPLMLRWIRLSSIPRPAWS